MMSELRVLSSAATACSAAESSRCSKTSLGLTLIVAGRSLSRAEELRSVARRPEARRKRRVRPQRDVAAQLARARADRRRRCQRPVPGVRRRALPPRRGVHRGAHSNYLDLADGARLRRRHRRVRCAGACGRRVLPGGSVELSVLTAAVVRRLANGLQRVDTIRAGIAPSPFAGVGENVIRAIARLCRSARAAAPERRRRATPSVHGATALHDRAAGPRTRRRQSRLFSLVDVPDSARARGALAQVGPERLDGRSPVPEILHRSLILRRAHLVRWRSRSLAARRSRR